MTRLPVWRIVLLRLSYLAIAAGLATFIVPRLIWLPDDWTSQGVVITCFLTAMMTLCAAGILRPLRMLPVMLFELVWKSVFMLRIAAPAWLNGTLEPAVETVFWECVPILLFIPIIPWRYVRDHHLPRRKQAAACAPRPV